MPLEAMTRLMMLRRSLLLHAYLYYALGESLINDFEWDRRGQEHLELQKEHGWNIGFYDEIFKHYEGQSGYWFPTNEVGLDDNIDRVAHRLLETDKKIQAMPDCVVLPSGAHYSASWLSGGAVLQKEEGVS